ncbi:DUF4190 domain-containing protein [Demequina flava]|uniref:DUF4190 domain-containing protein n=1 Tax=Demequina flava TaxID=1095025 RepID=UPI000781256A|nr:DUF4190 domain-containing protein [Demequina flava]
MDDTRDPVPDSDGQSLPTRRELREAEEAEARNDMGVSGPDATDPEDGTPAVDGDHDPSAEPIVDEDADPDMADAGVEQGGAPTEVMDPVEDDAPTAVMDPVDAPGDDAPETADGGQGTDGVAADGTAPADEPVSSERNWMGVTAFVTALLALSPVAIILGHLGLRAAKNGKATNRSFALAGTILGWVALVATGVGVYFYLQGPPAAQIDVYAQQDIHAVGAEVATQVVASNAMPVLSDSGTEYMVGDVTIASELEGAHEMTLTGDAPASWCLDLTYEGGENDAYSYLPTEGVVEGACS